MMVLPMFTGLTNREQMLSFPVCAGRIDTGFETRWQKSSSQANNAAKKRGPIGCHTIECCIWTSKRWISRWRSRAHNGDKELWELKLLLERDHIKSYVEHSDLVTHWYVRSACLFGKLILRTEIILSNLLIAKFLPGQHNFGFRIVSEVPLFQAIESRFLQCSAHALKNKWSHNRRPCKWPLSVFSCRLNCTLHRNIQIMLV